MKRIPLISFFAVLLIFTACEKKIDYEKRTYINHDIVIDDVTDPMLNLEWLKEKQAEFDADNSRQFKCRALLYFEDDRTSYPYIYEYKEYFSPDIMQFITCYKDTVVIESKYFAYLYFGNSIKGNNGYHIGFHPHFLNNGKCCTPSSHGHAVCYTNMTNVSENTSKHIMRFVNAALDGDIKQTNESYCQTRAYDAEGQILCMSIENFFMLDSKNIKVISCYKYEEIVK